MMSIKAMRRWLKTARGQLILFTATYAGAVVLAVGTLCLKTVLFEPYIRHRLPALTAEQQKLAIEIASGGLADNRVAELAASDVIAVYAALVDDQVEDPDGRLATAIGNFHSDVVMDTLRTTVVTGTAAQRRAAVRVLGKLDPSDRSQALTLCHYLQDRASRTGDESLADAVASVLLQLNPAKGEHQ